MSLRRPVIRRSDPPGRYPNETANYFAETKLCIVLDAGLSTHLALSSCITTDNLYRTVRHSGRRVTYEGHRRNNCTRCHGIMADLERRDRGCHDRSFRPGNDPTMGLCSRRTGITHITGARVFCFLRTISRPLRHDMSVARKTPDLCAAVPMRVVNRPAPDGGAISDNHIGRWQQRAPANL
jgi:hypothetical protein